MISTTGRRNLVLSFTFAILVITMKVCVIIFLSKSFYNQYIMPPEEHANMKNVEVDVDCKILVNSTCGGKLILILKANESLDVNFIEVYSSEGQQILSKTLALKLNPEERKEIIFFIDNFNFEIVKSLLASRVTMIKIILVSPNGIRFEKSVETTVSLDTGCKSCPISLSS